MKRALVLCLVCACASSAAADLLWDYGPSTGAYGGCWSNFTNGQNFAEQVKFDENVVIQGMDIWTCISAAGGNMHFKLLDDNNGNPGNYLEEFDLTHTSWTPDGQLYKVGFDFADIPLDAGKTYWVGISGNGWELGQASVQTPGDGRMAQFNGRNFSFHTTVGDQMFQLRGIPEPATLLLGLGLLPLVRQRS
jgi:hypothetical protein